MATPEFKYVESLLKEYVNYPKHINKRREELRFPVKQKDENLGGGSSSFNKTAPQEVFVIKLDQDKRLTRLEEQYLIITDVLDCLPKDEFKIIELYYLKTPRTLTWDGVAQQANCSRRRCFDVRNKVVVEIGKRLGLID